MTLSYGLIGGLALLWLASIVATWIGAERIGSKYGREEGKLDGWTEGWDARAKHLPTLLAGERAATRASLRDALTTLPRLHCSRSASGHVRVADVERLLADGHDG